MADQPTFDPRSPFGQAVTKYGMSKPDVSSEAYDKFRDSYFNSRIAPKVPQKDLQAQRERFMGRTNRPEMGVKNYVEALAQVGASDFVGKLKAFGAGIVENIADTPVGPIGGTRVIPEGGVKKAAAEPMRGSAEGFETLRKEARDDLAFHGHGGKMSAGGAIELGADVAAYSTEMLAMEGVGGPLGKVMPGAAAAMKGAPKISRSLTFGVISATEAKPGEKVSGFVSGTAFALGTEMLGAGLAAGYRRYIGKGGNAKAATLKDVDEALKKMQAGGAPETELEQSIDQSVADSLSVASKETSPIDTVKVHLDTRAEKPKIVLQDRNGNLHESQLNPLHPEKSYAALVQAFNNGAHKLVQVVHNEDDAGFVQEILAKVRQKEIPWSVLPTQIGKGAVDGVGGGTATVEGRVVKYNYAKQQPSRKEAVHFIRTKLGFADSDVVTQGQSEIDHFLQLFDRAWDNFGNNLNRLEAADRLEKAGLTDLIPDLRTRAKWGKGEEIVLPKGFDHDIWETVTDKLDLRTRDFVTNAIKVLWDPTVQPDSVAFTSALRAIMQHEELLQFVPGKIDRATIMAVINPQLGARAAEVGSKAIEFARTQAPAAPREHIYQTIGRLAETIARNPETFDEEALAAQHGRKTVDTAKEMAGLMIEKAEGDPLKLAWDEDIIKAGIMEDILPRVDQSGAPKGPWFSEGEKGLLAQATDLNSLQHEDWKSSVLKLADQYANNEKPDPNLVARVGDEGMSKARDIAREAKAKGVSVFDERAANGGSLKDFQGPEVFAPKEVPPSEMPSKLPGEPTAMPMRSIPLGDGSDGKFFYSIKRAASGLPSKIYVMINKAAADALNLGGWHLGPGDLGGMRSANKGLLEPVYQDLKSLMQLNGLDIEKVAVTFVQRPDGGFKTKLSASNVWHEDLHGIVTQIGYVLKQLGDTAKLRGEGGAVKTLLADIHGKADKAIQKTLGDLARSVQSQFPTLYTQAQNLEEGFVHAATAIRTGDASAIARFAKDDTDVESVYKAVQHMASELRLKAAELPPGNAKNMMMDRLGLIENFSNVDRYTAMRRVAEELFADMGDSPWSMMANGIERTFKSAKDFITMVEESLEGRLAAPNYTASFEMAGARQAMYPSQLSPGKSRPPMPDFNINEMEGGEMKFAGLWDKIAPALSFFDSVDKTINDKLSTKGMYLPIADSVRAVDETSRAALAWIDTNKQSAYKFLQGGKDKLETYGQMLGKPLKDWPQYAQQFGLTKEDLTRLAAAHEWMGKFESDTGIRVFDYLINQHPKLAKAGYDLDRVFAPVDKMSKMTTFQRLITKGDLDPKDLHLGKFIKVLLREGSEAKFTGKALDDLHKIVNLKTKGGKDYALGNLRKPLENYYNYMRGISDNSGRIIRDTVEGITDAVNSQIERFNKSLPGEFKVRKIDYEGNILRKLIVLNYIGNLGARPAIALRDSLQGPALSLPVVGMKVFAKGMKLAFTDEHIKLIEEAGGLLKGTQMEDIMNDVYQELSPGTFSKFVDKASILLAPSRIGHNVSRRAVFAGVYDTALGIVKKINKEVEGTYQKYFEEELARVVDFNAKNSVEGFTAQQEAAMRSKAKELAMKRGVTVSQELKNELLNDTGLWFADEARQKQLISLASDRFVPAKESAKQVALEMVDLTLWPYRRGTNPGVLKTGYGRILGQYGLWPMSYIDYLRRMTTKLGTNPKKAIGAFVTWGAVNYGLIEAGKKAGIDVSRWFGVSPAGFEGSPHLAALGEFAGGVVGGDPKKRKEFAQYLTQFIPASNEIKALGPIMSEDFLDEEGHLTDAGKRVLGFKPYKKQGVELEDVLLEDADLTPWLDKQTGGVVSATDKEFDKWTR